MTTRRNLLVAGAALPALAWASAARAQVLANVRRIGLLSTRPPSDAAPLNEAFRQGLRDLGWIEGKNINIEYRYAEGRSDRLPEFAIDLIRLKVDVIVASGVSSALAAQRASGTVPIVIAVGSGPVGSGLAESLARPGGNVTGMSNMTVELGGKRLELLKEMVPKLSRVAVLWNPQGAGSALNWKELQIPARQLGVQLYSMEVRSTSEINKAFEDAIRARAGALFVTPDSVLDTDQKRITDLAAKARLPSMHHASTFADVGGLAAYGPDSADLFRRAATFVDKILKGAKPADLPVEQPTKFELVVNLKTAKDIGITIPPSVMVRATKVIE